MQQVRRLDLEIATPAPQHRWPCMRRVGDAVFGQGTGCLGTAVLVDARTVVPMPPNVTFTQAATVPTVFLTAYDCLFDVAEIGNADHVLVHAATGAACPVV